jgi:uncharacterized membrane protein YozB (DUF420 family)
MSDWDKVVMMDSFGGTARAGRQAKRIASVLILSAISGFVLYTAAKAVSPAFANDDFPESLAVKLKLLPLIFPIHMITGGLALILLPLAILLRHRPNGHRLAGRIAAFDVLVAGLTAFPVAWAAPVTTWSAAGFSAQAATWLTLLVLGIRNIRRRRIVAHRTCMVLMVATASGAVFFRIYLALWVMLGTPRWFDSFYACDAWVAWLAPLILSAAVMSSRRPSRHAPIMSAAG